MRFVKRICFLGDKIRFRNERKLRQLNSNLFLMYNLIVWENLLNFPSVLRDKRFFSQLFLGSTLLPTLCVFYNFSLPIHSYDSAYRWLLFGTFIYEFKMLPSLVNLWGKYLYKENFPFKVFLFWERTRCRCFFFIWFDADEWHGKRFRM